MGLLAIRYTTSRNEIRTDEIAMNVFDSCQITNRGNYVALMTSLQYYTNGVDGNLRKRKSIDR